MEKQIYKMPYTSKGSQMPSYLIMVFDGTGSMNGEYQIMLDAYKQVFQEEIRQNRVHGIQFGYKITSLEPYQHACTGADHNAAFQSCLTKMQENLNADITICVISDGEEYSDIKQLESQIIAAKKRYQIQFTSIAVGTSYPFSLFQQFRDYFHNGAPSCPVVQQVDRSNITGSQLCKQNFIQKFNMVKSILKQQSVIQLKQQVQKFIGDLPSYQAQEGSVVISESDKLETVEGKEINETKNLAYVAEIIQTSCQQFIVQQQNSQFKDTAKQAAQMKKEATQLLKRTNSSKSLHTEQVSKFIAVVEKDLEILDDIGEGRLQLNKLSDAEKTKLQESFNPKREEIQQAQPQQITPEQKAVFEQQLVNLINEKSSQSGQMVLLSVLSDYLDDAIQEEKSSEDIMKELLTSKKKSLKTIQDYAIKHKEWVEKFIDCYIKVT